MNSSIRKFVENFIKQKLSGKNFLQEVSKEDFEKGDVIQVKPNSYEWYMGKKGALALKHTKVLFGTKKLQREICKEYRLHDPTKVQDKCIEVLLCRPNIKGYENKWVAISTLRKLTPECVMNHIETYAKVPEKVLRRAIASLKKEIAPGHKETLSLVVKTFVEKLKKMDPKLKKEILRKARKDKPIEVNSKEEFIKKVILRETGEDIINRESLLIFEFAQKVRKYIRQKIESLKKNKKHPVFSKIFFTKDGAVLKKKIIHRDFGVLATDKEIVANKDTIRKFAKNKGIDFDSLSEEDKKEFLKNHTFYCPMCKTHFIARKGIQKGEISDNKKLEDHMRHFHTNYSELLFALTVSALRKLGAELKTGLIQKSKLKRINPEKYREIKVNKTREGLNLFKKHLEQNPDPGFDHLI